MSYAHAKEARAAELTNTILAAAAAIGRAVARRYRLYRSMRALNALSDTMLKDIGISRSDTAAAARGDLYRGV